MTTSHSGAKSHASGAKAANRGGASVNKNAINAMRFREIVLDAGSRESAAGEA
jgi:hypothetical protein